MVEPFINVVKNIGYVNLSKQDLSNLLTGLYGEDGRSENVKPDYSPLFRLKANFI